MAGEQTGLQVIGAGFGRTGTASLKRALERLGFGPCHHMEELFAHPGEVPVWEAAGRGEPVDWAALMRPWRAAVDVPAALYYRELAETFPDAKVILTLRDPEAWYGSFSTTVAPLITRFPNPWIAPWLPRIQAPFRVTRHLHHAFVSREAAIRMFSTHNAQVKEQIPAERLLVYEVKQGWEPLCAFLGVPVPDEPFPRVNDAATFQRRGYVVNAICWAVLLAPLALSLAAAAAVLALMG